MLLTYTGRGEPTKLGALPDSYGSGEPAAPRRQSLFALRANAPSRGDPRLTRSFGTSGWRAMLGERGRILSRHDGQQPFFASLSTAGMAIPPGEPEMARSAPAGGRRGKERLRVAQKATGGGGPQAPRPV